MTSVRRFAGAALVAATCAVPIATGQERLTDPVADALRHEDAPARLRAGGVAMLPRMLDVLVSEPDEAVAERILRGFASFDSKAVLAATRGALSDAQPVASRIAAMRAITASPTPDALPALYAACPRNASFSLKHEFEHTVATVFHHAPGAIHTTTRNWRHVPAHLRSNVLHAIGSAATRPGLDWLAEQLWYQTKHELIVLTGITKLAPLARPDQATDITEQLRDRLDPSDPALCQAASLAVAAFRDVESVPLLIALLSAETRGVRENALWALRQISGRSFGSNAAQWQAWFDAEDAWLEKRAPRVFESLDNKNAEAIAAALREIAAHTVFRDTLTDAVTPLLRHKRTAVAVLVCTTLAHLGSRRAIEPLIDALKAENETREKAALVALRKLTGCDLPAESDRWRETLLDADAVPSLLAPPTAP